MNTPENTKDKLQPEYDTNFNLDKMKLGVNAPYYMLPKGLTIEEFNTWIESKATNP